MKLLLVAALITTTAAFAPAPIARRSVASTLFESASATAIEAALEASKTHGPTSTEARLLWEVVEEMNASDNRCVLFFLHRVLPLEGVFGARGRHVSPRPGLMNIIVSILFSPGPVDTTRSSLSLNPPIPPFFPNIISINNKTARRTNRPSSMPNTRPRSRPWHRC